MDKTHIKKILPLFLPDSKNNQHKKINSPKTKYGTFEIEKNRKDNIEKILNDFFNY